MTNAKLGLKYENDKYSLHYPVYINLTKILTLAQYQALVDYEIISGEEDWCLDNEIFNAAIYTALHDGASTTKQIAKVVKESLLEELEYD